MARKKVRTNWKLALAFKDLQVIAPNILSLSKFACVIGPEAVLQASSGLWEKANGTITARLVYRTPLSSSLVVTIGGLPRSAAKVVNG